MTLDVMYTTSWNFLKGRLPRDHEWLDAGEARRLYEGNEGLMVVDAMAKNADGTPVPRWVIGFGTLGPRVTFIDAMKSIWRQVDWKRTDGRWWRWITYDNEYPNEARQWSEHEALFLARTIIHPNGSGRIDIAEGDMGPEQVQEFTGGARSSYWTDIATFGDWSALTDPEPSSYQVAGLTVSGKEAMRFLASESSKN